MIDIAKAIGAAYDRFVSAITAAVRSIVAKPELGKYELVPFEQTWLREIRRQTATIGAQRTRASKLDYRKVKSQRRNMGRWGPRR